MQMLWTTTLALLMLLAPGWALLGTSGIARRFSAFQRWCLALCFGAAFYPLLFYFARLIPGLSLGRNKLAVILALCGLLILFFFRRDWKEQFQFDAGEIIGLSILLLTLFTRIWPLQAYPFPAWSDSLHHTELTQLTAQQGRLPYDMQPYEPIPLGMYHLGLYALSGSFQILTGLPAHTALLYIAQLLNAFCVLGVYLVLDCFFERKTALAGAVLVGLLSFQPAWYFNWGRFTQAASQALLLPAWLLTVEAIQVFREKSNWRDKIGVVGAAALLTAAVFQLHFRVAGLYLPLLLVTGEVLLVQQLRAKQNPAALLISWLLIGIVSLVLVLPALRDSLSIYAASAPARLANAGAPASLEYFSSPLRDIFLIGLHPWLAILAGLSAVLGLLRRNHWVLVLGGWVLLLWGIGNIYRTGQMQFAFINISAIMIMLYLPATLLAAYGIGFVAGQANQRYPLFQKPNARLLLASLAVLLAAGGAVGRVSDREKFRYFLAPESFPAMDWIRQNTPEDALFAIDTYMWLGNSPHGTDSGYWIPYLTGRKITTGSMMQGAGDAAYKERIRSLSTLVVGLSPGESTLDDLCAAGIDYVFIGEKSDRFHSTLDREQLLLRYPEQVRYSHNGSVIFAACTAQD